MPNTEHFDKSCCTCTAWLDSLPDQAVSEKPLRHRDLDCCGRIICQPCLNRNPRFANYCPFCPNTTHLVPPLYEPPSASSRQSPPPPYDPNEQETDENIVEVKGKCPPLPPFGAHVGHEDTPMDEKSKSKTDATAAGTIEIQAGPLSRYDDNFLKGLEVLQGPSVIHNLRHPHDSVSSLSLLYGIPPDVLRRHNKLSSDSLLAGRHAVLIPARYAPLGSQSPYTAEDEEERTRKVKIRRFMMTTRCAEYKLAQVYVEQAGWDVDVAAGRWVDDEAWERENPRPEKRLRGGEKAREVSRVPFWRRK